MNRVLTSLALTLATLLFAGCGGTAVTAPTADSAVREVAGRPAPTRTTVLQEFPVTVSFKNQSTYKGLLRLSPALMMRGMDTRMELAFPQLGERISVAGHQVVRTPIIYTGSTVRTSGDASRGEAITDTLNVTLTQERGVYTVSGNVIRDVKSWFTDSSDKVITRESQTIGSF